MPCRRTDRPSLRVCHRGLHVAGHHPCDGHNNNQGLCGHHHNLPVGNHRTLQVSSHHDGSAAEVETGDDGHRSHCDEEVTEIARGDRMGDLPCSNDHHEDVPRGDLHDDPLACNYQDHHAKRNKSGNVQNYDVIHIQRHRMQREQVYHVGLYRPSP